MLLDWSTTPRFRDLLGRSPELVRTRAHIVGRRWRAAGLGAAPPAAAADAVVSSVVEGLVMVAAEVRMVVGGVRVARVRLGIHEAVARRRGHAAGTSASGTPGGATGATVAARVRRRLPAQAAEMGAAAGTARPGLVVVEAGLERRWRRRRAVAGRVRRGPHRAIWGRRGDC